MTDNNKRTFESGSNLDSTVENTPVGPATNELAGTSHNPETVVENELNERVEDVTLADAATDTFHTNDATHVSDTRLDEGAETEEVRRDRLDRERAAENTNRNTTTHTDTHRTSSTDRHPVADKPFYTTWWFWVVVVLLLLAIWYFGFRTPTA